MKNSKNITLLQTLIDNNNQLTKELRGLKDSNKQIIEELHEINAKFDVANTSLTAIKREAKSVWFPTTIKLILALLAAFIAIEIAYPSFSQHLF